MERDSDFNLLLARVKFCFLRNTAEKRVERGGEREREGEREEHDEKSGTY